MPVPNAQSGLTRFLSHDAMEQGETNPFSDYLKHHSGEFIGFIVGGMIALILTYCICREYINTKWGHGCCYGPQEAARHRATMLRELRLQTMADARVVAELQRELDNEREQQLSENRKQERREKYERFLKPYTMVSSQTYCFNCFKKRLGTSRSPPINGLVLHIHVSGCGRLSYKRSDSESDLRRYRTTSVELEVSE
jgi:hypothetical protein